MPTRQPDADDIRQVRSFSRTVTEGIGVLHDHFLGRGRPLGESRILWEIGPGGVEIRALRQRLALDSGYVSRVLRSLEQQRLVRVKPSREDARVRHAILTPAGHREREELDRRSDLLAADLLAPLAGRHRRRLIDAMTEVAHLLQASMVHFAIENPSSADARWCFEQYFDELARRFEAGFDPARTISAQAAEITPPNGFLVLARLRGAPVGCGALKLHRRAPAELKRMWLSPAVRGLGVGRRLLEEIEKQARQRGVRRLHLETNSALKEAIALYRSAGYRETQPFNTEPYAHHWFEKRLS